MKFYKVIIRASFAPAILDTREYSTGKEFKDFKRYLVNKDTANQASGYDKKNREVYREFSSGYWEKYIYNNSNIHVKTIDSDGDIEYPMGMYIYKKYIKNKKKELLK